MPETAGRKVLAVLAALPVPTIGAPAEIGRDTDDEPFQQSELPAWVLRILEVSFEPFQDMTLATATIQADFICKATSAGVIDLVNQNAIAEFVAAIHADRTLGGRLQSLEEATATGSEQNGPNTGAAILQLQAVWFSPRGNLYTIVGHAGATF